MQFFLPEKCDDAIQSVPSVSHLVNTIFFPTGKKQAFKKIYPPKFKSLVKIIKIHFCLCHFNILLNYTRKIKFDFTVILISSANQ